MRSVFYVFLTSLLLLSSGLRADVLELRADSWCPYNCEPNSDREGYVIDMVRRIFPARGIRVDYILTPWTRSLQMTMNQEHVAAPGAYPSRNRNHVFAEEAAGYSVNTLIVRKDNSWRFDGYRSLQSILLGVVDGYEYSDELTVIQKAYPERFVALNGDEPLERLLRMVRIGRIDAALDDMNVMNYLMAKPGLGTGLITGGTLPNGEIVSIAFSPAGPAGARYSRIFSEGVRALRKSGELQTILAPYGLEDWADKVRLLKERQNKGHRN